MTAVARPVVAPPEPWDFPPAVTHDLPNGLRLLTYDVPGQYVLVAAARPAHLPARRAS